MSEPITVVELLRTIWATCQSRADRFRQAADICEFRDLRTLAKELRTYAAAEELMATDYRRLEAQERALKEKRDAMSWHERMLGDHDGR